MDKSFVISVLLSTVLLSACATKSVNGGANKLSVVEKVTINAPADKVWSKVADFGDLGAWHPAVANTEITRGTNNKQGAVRKVNPAGWRHDC